MSSTSAVNEANDRSVTETEGFQAAQALFEAEDTTPETPAAEPQSPKPVVEGEVAEPPKAESAQEAAETPRSPEISALEKKLDSLEREARRYREQSQYWMQNYQQVVKPPAPVATPNFTDARPKRDDFNGDDTAWVQADNDWAARKAEHTALTRARQEFIAQQTERQQQEIFARQQQYLDARIHEGRTKFGQAEFDDSSDRIADFVTPTMHQALFRLKAFPEVVVELGRNPQEAQRIARLHPDDQIYELKALERRISTKQELKNKEQQMKPTTVEAPGQGEPPKTAPSLTKLRNAAFESGSLRDFARVFEAMPD